MVRWPLALLVFALAFLLAGCSSPDSAKPATPGPVPSASATAAAPATAAAGTAASKPLPVPVLLDWDGAVDPEACVPTGLGSCSGLSVPNPGNKASYVTLPEEPAAWSGSLTMTWQASTPATQTLRLALAFYKPCGASCWATTGDAIVVEGPSPLVLDVAGLAAPADAEGLDLGASAPSLTPSPAYAVVEPGQDFHVEGRLEASALPSAPQPAASPPPTPPA